MRKSIKRMIATVSACVMALAFATSVVPNTALAANDPTEEAIAAGKATLNLDEGAEYNAYLLFQVQESWVYRNSWFEKDTGRESAIWNQVSSSLNVTDPFKVDGDIQDAVIKGNGTYTVKVENLNGSLTSPGGTTPSTEPVLSILGISTDIPMNDTIKFSDVKVKIDGGAEKTATEVVYDDDAKDAPGTITVDLVNAYHEEYAQMTGLTVPQSSLEITFTVSGFNYDNPDAVEATPEATEAADNGSADSEKSGMSTTAVVVIVVVAVVVIAGVVVVTKKKKK